MPVFVDNMKQHISSLKKASEFEKTSYVAKVLYYVKEVNFCRLKINIIVVKIFRIVFRIVIRMY